jgi:hypothetical protein
MARRDDDCGTCGWRTYVHPPEPKYTHRLGSATRAAQRVTEALEQVCGQAESWFVHPSRFDNGCFSIGAERSRTLCEATHSAYRYAETPQTLSGDI